jgi:hypothetical protein
VQNEINCLNVFKSAIYNPKSAIRRAGRREKRRGSKGGNLGGGHGLVAGSTGFTIKACTEPFDRLRTSFVEGIIVARELWLRPG